MKYWPLECSIHIYLLQTGGVSREVAVVQVSNWPAQCSPLSTVFDLVKLVDEESLRATQGRRDHPILVLDRWV